MCVEGVEDVEIVEVVEVVEVVEGDTSIGIVGARINIRVLQKIIRISPPDSSAEFRHNIPKVDTTFQS
jgi:hypothetical protein